MTVHGERTVSSHVTVTIKGHVTSRLEHVFATLGILETPAQKVIFLYLSYDSTVNPYKPSVLFVGHRQTVQTRSDASKLFSHSNPPCMKLILLIGVKMPTFVGILTFISRIKIQHLSALRRKIT